MHMKTAIEIILDLAEQNIVSERDMPDEHERQVAAIKKVREGMARMEAAAQ